MSEALPSVAYADAVASGSVLAWLMDHECSPMPEPEPARVIQLYLWPELEAA